MSADSLQTQMQKRIAEEDWPGAAEVIYKLLRAQPESSWLHCNMGWVLFQMGDFKNAEEHLRITLALDPSYADAHANLAWIYWGLQRTGTADDNNQAAMALDPNNIRSLELAVYLALYYDDIPKAKEFFRRVEGLDDDITLITDLRTAVLSHPKNKEEIDIEAQLQTHKDQLAADPEHAPAHYHSAKLHLKYTKNYKAAYEHSKQALALQPDNLYYQQVFTDSNRRRNPIMRILCAPYYFCSDSNTNYSEVFLFIFLIGLGLSAVYLTAEVGKQLELPAIIIVGLLLFIYPCIRIYDYLHLTEFYHKTENTKYLGGMLGFIHRLPLIGRVLACLFITLAVWAFLGLWMSGGMR